MKTGAFPILVTVIATSLLAGQVAAADFNGDGFDDVAIGIPAETLVGVTGSVGAVSVIYGSANGLLAIHDQLWSQNSPNVEQTAEDGDLFGAAVATGDFNNDGYADLAIGAPGEEPVGGAVHVLYGSGRGLSATSPRPDQLFSQATAGIPGHPETGDGFGSSLTAADYNGDGYVDLAIGMPKEDHEYEGVKPDAGSLVVIHGSAQGLKPLGTPAAQIWDQYIMNLGFSEAGDQFAFSLAAGDFNGDGFADLVAGVPYEDDLDDIDPGGANVLYGSPDGLSDTYIAPQYWSQDIPFIGQMSENYDRFGSSLATGDFNGDGYSDLAVGIPYESYEDKGIIEIGGVIIIHGSAQGLAVPGVEASQFWWQDHPDVEETAEGFDQFGFTLAAGRLNADAYDDLAIGAPLESLVDVFEGVVHVIHGSPNGLSATFVPDQLWSQASPGISDDPDHVDNFGWSLSIGNFGHSAHEDLAIGVPGETLGNIAYCGAINVIYGSASGLRSQYAQFLNQDVVNIEEQCENFDAFGKAVAASR